MEKLILFIAEQWLLVAALLSCLMLLSFHESRRASRRLSTCPEITTMGIESM